MTYKIADMVGAFDGGDLTANIIGTGTSLNELQYPPKGISFCLNGASVHPLFNDNWDCWVVADKNILKDDRQIENDYFKRSIERKSGIKFISTELAREYGSLDHHHFVVTYGMMKCDVSPVTPNDYCGYVAKGSYTVADVALQIAVIMGFEDIVLYGVDMCHRNGRRYAVNNSGDSTPHSKDMWEVPAPNGESVLINKTMERSILRLHDTIERIGEAGIRVRKYTDIGMLDIPYIEKGATNGKVV